MKNENAYFVTKEFVARRTRLQYFRSESNDVNLSMNDVRRIKDYKPLGKDQKCIFRGGLRDLFPSSIVKIRLAEVQVD